jgi:putative transposase
MRCAWPGFAPSRAGLIFHSDRGSQYASNDYRKARRCVQGDQLDEPQRRCWDNAVTETLFGSLKVERLHGMRFDMRRLAKDEVMDRLLQPSTASFNAGLYQSDGLQTEMACPGN